MGFPFVSVALQHVQCFNVFLKEIKLFINQDALKLIKSESKGFYNVTKDFKKMLVF